MTINLLRKGFTQCHEECRPDERVESYDFLCHYVHISRPVLLVVIVSIVHEAEQGDIVRKSVHPNIDVVTFVNRYRDAPLNACSGYTEILKTRLDEVVDHLINSGLRLKEILLRIKKQRLKLGSKL